MEPTDDSEPTAVPASFAPVEVTDPDGAPVDGANVYWYQPGYPVFRCDPNSEPLPGGYVWSGQAKTDETGRARLELPWHESNPRPASNRPYPVQLIGPNGARALSSTALPARTSTFILTPSVDVDVEFTCDGQPCDDLSGKARITDDGGSCHFSQRDLRDGGLRMAGVPQGTLELEVNVAQGTSVEARAVKNLELDDDLNATVDLSIIGGPHSLAGRVALADGSATKGDDYWVSVDVQCANGLTRSTTPSPQNGDFEFSHMPAVDCTLTATRRGYQDGPWLRATTTANPASVDAANLVITEQN
jgi:hypothetical protein